MAKLRTFRNSFAAGHVDKQFLSRSDANEFANACETLTNFELTLSGGARRRQGGIVIDDAHPGYRLLAFEFVWGGENLKRLVSIGIGTLRFINPDTGVTRDEAAPEIDTLEKVWECDFCKALNTVIVVHTDFAPFRLSPAGGSTLLVKSALPWVTGNGGRPKRPFHRPPDTSTTWLKPNVRTGAATVSALTSDITGIPGGDIVGELDPEVAYFSAADVGQWIKLADHAWFKILVAPLGTYDHQASGIIYGEVPNVKILTVDPASARNLYAIGDILTGDTTAATARVLGLAETSYTSSGYTDHDGQVTGQQTITYTAIVIEELTGTLKAPAYWSGGSVPPAQSEDVTNGVTISRTVVLADGDGTDQWIGNFWAREQWLPAASGVLASYPGAAIFHAGRLWFAASRNEPNYVWGSNAQDFYNFDVGQGFPDEALAVPLIGETLDEVLYLVDGPGLEIYSDQQEVYVSGYDRDPITPENFRATPGSRYGASRIKPVRMSFATFFIERGGAAIYRQFYDNSIRGMRTELVSGLATSLVRDPVQVTAQRNRRSEGQEVLWGVNSDGTAFQLRWWPQTADVAMSLMTRAAGESWLSLAYIGDERFGIVSLPNGSRVLEQSSDEVLMDQATLLTEVNPTQVWAVPARFAPGTLVDVLTDEEPGGTTTDRAIVFVGQFTVDSSNEIDIGLQDYMRIWVGRTAEAVVKPTPIDFTPMDGDTRLIPKKVVSYGFPVLDSFYFRVGDREYWYRQPSNGGLFPVPRDNEDIRAYQLGYSNRQAPAITTDLPLPVTVLGVIAEVEF